MYKAKNKYNFEQVTLMLAEGAESSSNVHFKAKLRPAGGGPGPGAAGVSIVQAQADLIGALCSAWLCSAGTTRHGPGSEGLRDGPGTAEQRRQIASPGTDRRRAAWAHARGWRRNRRLPTLRPTLLPALTRFHCLVLLWVLFPF